MYHMTHNAPVSPSIDMNIKKEASEYYAVKWSEW